MLHVEDSLMGMGILKHELEKSSNSSRSDVKGDLAL
jgi:hypothetical protein